MRGQQFFLLIFLFFLVSCKGISPASNGGVQIVPSSCNLYPSQEISLSLQGTVPPNAKITWQVTSGAIVQAPTGYTATYTAPSQPGFYKITVTIEEPGKPPTNVSLECKVEKPMVKTLDVVTPSMTSMPLSTSTPVSTFTPLIFPTPTPSATVVSKPTLIITEFMGNPCGGDEITPYNQYIELYNYGKQPVDVAGLWLYTGISQKIIAWDAHEPSLSALESGITSSTVIPPGGFALILSPLYTNATPPYQNPYASIPEHTIILTVEEKRLGKTKSGIVAYGQGRDVILLYRGGRTILEEIISTYGTPHIETFVEKLRDDYRDALPFDLPECRSANLKKITEGDKQSNWELIYGGTPGEGPYKPLP